MTLTHDQYKRLYTQLHEDKYRRILRALNQMTMHLAYEPRLHYMLPWKR